MKTTILLILISMLSLTNCDKKDKQKNETKEFPSKGTDVEAVVRQVKEDCFILILGDNPNIDLSLKENATKISEPVEGISIPKDFRSNGFKVYITYDFRVNSKRIYGTCYYWIKSKEVPGYGARIRLIKIKKR